MPAYRIRSETRAFGGVQGFYEHHSQSCGGTMRFGVYLPPRALLGERVPVLYYLAGLTCTEETFAIKAGAQRQAAALDLALVTCDTSPRSARFAGDDADWDFGLGAGFYLDATQEPWASAYRMHSYIVRDLRDVVERYFPIASDSRGIFGHSMGGHGALTIALSHPGEYRSVSAFAPIVAPSQVQWGQKAFSAYLGQDRATWLAYDATELVKVRQLPCKIRIDQGLGDKFLESQLQPERFERACNASGQALDLKRHAGYDHSYYFIATFVDAHLEHHARTLRG